MYEVAAMQNKGVETGGALLPLSTFQKVVCFNIFIWAYGRP